MIVLLCTFVGGGFTAYVTGNWLMEILGFDLDAQPTVTEFVFFIIGLLIWYPLWSFIGLIVGLVVSRPLCGPKAASALGGAGHFYIPILTPTYVFVVTKLYDSNS